MQPISTEQTVNKEQVKRLMTLSKCHLTTDQKKKKKGFIEK